MGGIDAAMEGRVIFEGRAEGDVLASEEAISFYGGVDPDTGVVTEKGHPLEGTSVAGSVLVFPRGKGSTVGSYTLYRLKRNGVAPAAIVVEECDTVVAVGAIISEIPCVDRIPVDRLATGMAAVVEAGRVSAEPRS